MSTLHVLGNPHSIEHYVDSSYDAQVRHHASVEELLSVAEPGDRHKCLIDANSRLDVSNTLSNIASLLPSLPVLVIGDGLPAEAVRALSRIQTWDTLSPAATPEDVVKSLESLRANPQPIALETPSSTGECYAFVSTVGGAGATLLAVEAAYQLRQSKTPPSVCLVDLNFFDGMVPTYLNCEPGLNPSNLSKDARAIDPVLLNSLVTQHTYGIDVIAAPSWTQKRYHPSRDYVLSLLDIACEQYDIVLLDLPRWPHDWSSDVLSGCDAVILVSELTVPALNASRRWIEFLASDPSTQAVKIKPILNRQKASVFGTRVSAEQADSALSRPVFGQVRSDWSAALAAVNLGQAVGHTKPGSLISKDMADIIRRLRQETIAGRAEPAKEAA
ncbi:MAG: hypothetical protein NXH72_12290 [Hyphomonadaceae bacterium]|nr:hypothetical protein [Hyphomonadaceae bacterium]